MNMIVMEKRFIRACVLPTEISFCHQASFSDTHVRAHLYRSTQSTLGHAFLAQLLFLSYPLRLLLPCFSGFCYADTRKVERIW